MIYMDNLIALRAAYQAALGAANPPAIRAAMAALGAANRRAYLTAIDAKFAR
jgi:hypothetical protein